MTTTLSSTEEKIARLVARRRHESNRAAGIKNQRKGPQSDEYTDLNGFGGELAVAKLLNRYPQLEMDPSAGGVDGSLSGGRTYDVKTTKYTDGHLMARPETVMKEHADVYILVTGEMPEYTIRGWLESENLFQSRHLKDLGTGQSLAVPQSELKDIEELL